MCRQYKRSGFSCGDFIAPLCGIGKDCLQRLLVEYGVLVGVLVNPDYDHIYDRLDSHGYLPLVAWQWELFCAFYFSYRSNARLLDTSGLTC